MLISFIDHPCGSHGRARRAFYWNLAGAAIGIRFSEVGLLFANVPAKANDGDIALVDGKLALAYLIIAALITLLYVDYKDVAKL